MQQKTIPQRYDEAAEMAALMTFDPDCGDPGDFLESEEGREMVEDNRRSYDALAAEHEALYEQTRWRDVRHEWPPSEKPFVLTTGPNFDGVVWYCIARHLGDGDFRGAHGEDVNLTHWMQLPPPPGASVIR